MIFRGGLGSCVYDWRERFSAPPFLVAGCASQTGVVPNGQGGYLIAKQAATGFPGLGNLKAEAMGEANQYCQGQGREFLMETQPPYLLGNYPRAEISFQCVPPQSPRR
jgi:hypothetical protein